MAKKLTELNAATSVANGDIFMIVTDVSDTALIETKKITANNLANTLYTMSSGNNITANIVGGTISVGVNDVPSFFRVNFRQTLTPANSSYISNTVSLSAGDAFYDADYLYVVTSNSAIKRVALSTF